MRKLIKDFRDYQFVFYWYEKGTGRISPLLPTLHHAEDWATQQQRKDYSGTERRKRTPDDAHIAQRRKTDRRLEIDLDISTLKIAELKQSFAA